MIISIIEKRCFAAVTHGGDSGESYLLAGLRDSASIRLMSDCLLRVSEVNCGDLKDNTLTIRQSKTDQFGEGRVLFVGDETVQVIEELKAKANISRGALFRRVLKDSKIDDHTAHARSRAEKSLRNAVKESKGRVLGHSLRVGSDSVVSAGQCVAGGDASGRSMERFTNAVPLCKRGDFCEEQRNGTD